jgi:hypothetical protein
MLLTTGQPERHAAVQEVQLRLHVVDGVDDEVPAGLQQLLGGLGPVELGDASTLQSGFTSRQRCAISSALLFPTVRTVAWSWRLRLVTQTSSKSTSVRWPRPLRTRPSTA